MRLFLVGVLVLGNSLTCLCDIYLLHVGGDNWQEVRNLSDLPFPANQDTTAELRIIRVDSGGGSPPKPNPPGDVGAQIERITRETITQQLHATVLLSVVRRVKQARDREAAMDEAIKVMAAEPLFEGNKFSEWWQRVKPLAGGNFSEAFFQLIDESVTKATGASSAAANSLVAAGITGDAGSIVAAAVEGTVGPKAIAEMAGGNFMKIIEFIIRLFEILKQLGLFGAA